MGVFVDISGKKFGRLLVLGFSHKDRLGVFYWKVICNCGKEKNTRGSSLKNGTIKSCGCLHSEITSRRLSEYNYKHGMCNTSTYSSWALMKQRCLDKKCKAFKNYGGRGITVCKRWMEFENFYADMGEKPDGLTLDRTDNNGNYEPSNCAWRTWIDQQNNRNNNHFLTYNGATLTIAQWARNLNVSYDMLIMRAYRGWPTERILSV